MGQEKIESFGSITGNDCIAEITEWMHYCDVSGLRNGDSTASTFWKHSEIYSVARVFMFQNIGTYFQSFRQWKSSCVAETKEVFT